MLFIKFQPMRHSKLEKADILDLTVKHLQDMERRKLAIAMAVDPSVADKFKNGFNECIDEIDKYLNTVSGVDSGMKQRVSNHLKSYLRYQRFPQSGAVGPFGGLFGRTTDEINNNGRLAVDGMPLIPSLLPSGELAFIMPHNSTGGLPFFPRLPTGQGLPSINSDHFKPIFHEKQPYAPSPPLSPVSDHESVKGDLKTTPLIKTRPGLMESLMAAFPTPPTPEESSRISAFKPNHKLIDRIRLHRESEKDERLDARDAKRTKVEKEVEFSEDESDSEGDEEEHGPHSGGDMWRPW